MTYPLGDHMTNRIASVRLHKLSPDISALEPGIYGIYQIIYIHAFGIYGMGIAVDGDAQTRFPSSPTH